MAVMRGEVWTVSGGITTSKRRPAVIIQSDRFSETASVTLVPCTTDPIEAPLLRLDLEPDSENGLRFPCRLMVDKTTTVPKANLGQRVGRLSDDDLIRLNRAAVVFLGLV
jgi:mRNA interferase MazF